MGLLSESDRGEIRRVLSDLPGDVRIVFFTQQFECGACKTTHELLDELVELSPRLRLEVHELVADKAAADSYGVDKVPAIALVGKRDYGIRFKGLPAGYEFAAFLEALVDVSRGAPSVSPGVAADAGKVDRPVHVQVLVSPSCPYCPRAVRSAHKLAMLNPNIRADMVEVSEYPFLAIRYGVQGVPHTVINDVYHVVGAVPEDRMIKEILKAIGK